MTGAHRLLLDCTRAVSRAWAGAMPTGIDRVCDAYLAHYAPEALAVLQLRGRARVLGRAQSQRLFAMLGDGPARFRARFAPLAVQAGVRGADRAEFAGGLYLNVSHTDFDLESHRAWIEANGLRPVYMVHDLIPIEHPDATTPHKVARHRGRVLRALHHGSGIIANSRATAASLEAFAKAEGLTPPPIVAAPLGVPEMPAAPRPASDGPARFVCVGTIEPRKNHMLLLDVWQRLIAQFGEAAPRLELIGKWGVASEPVRRRLQADPLLRRFIAVESGLTDATIAARLARAKALLAPSRAEGFGLTVIEALALGVPVIASDLPSLREGGGDIPTFLAPDHTDDWLRTVIAFAVDEAERHRQLAALADYRAPSWEGHFARVDGWLRTLRPQLRIVAAAHSAPARSAASAVPAAVCGLESAG